MKYSELIIYYTITLCNIIIFFKAWKNREFPYGQITMYLAELLCILYFFQHFFPEFTELFSVNKNNSRIEIYRFFTANFLHFSFIHLIVNLFYLIFLGSIFEEKYGSKKLILTFIFGGICTFILSILFVNNTSMGAGGATFLLLGILVASGNKLPYKKTIITLNLLALISSLFFNYRFVEIESIIGFILGYFLFFVYIKNQFLLKLKIIRLLHKLARRSV